jgi:hypothetical protein
MQTQLNGKIEIDTRPLIALRNAYHRKQATSLMVDKDLNEREWGEDNAAR